MARCPLRSLANAEGMFGSGNVTEERGLILYVINVSVAKATVVSLLDKT